MAAPGTDSWGRIVLDGEGFKIEALKPGETEGVSLKRGERLKPYAEALKPDTLKPETCAGCETLKREIETLQERIAALEMPPAPGQRSNYAGAANSHRLIDPPGPNWGA